MLPTTDREDPYQLLRGWMTQELGPWGKGGVQGDSEPVVESSTNDEPVEE
jgi:hypothetical protein